MRLAGLRRMSLSLTRDRRAGGADQTGSGATDLTATHKPAAWAAAHAASFFDTCKEVLTWPPASSMCALWDSGRNLLRGQSKADMHRTFAIA